MLSEDFDKKIKEAADHHYPAYREEAWKNMNRLLDKHLPEKDKDRKRFILFFLLLIGLAIGSMWLLLPGARKNYQMASEQASPVTQQQKEQTSIQPNPIQAKDHVPSHSVKETEPIGNQSASNNNTRNSKRATTSQFKQRVRATRSQYGQIQKQGALKGNANETVPGEREKMEILKETMTGTMEEGVTQSVEDHIKTDSLLDARSKEDLSDSAANLQNAEKAPERKGKPSVGSRFSILFSAGPDISYASGQAGKLETVKGIGIAYQVNDRLSLRTGFYAARKIYTAAPEDYKFSGNIGNYYPNLKWVDGDCIVYEIPLLVNYHFLKKEKSSWFVSGGLSSLLMHTEEYNYYYKPWASGNMMHKKWIVSNKNQHFFSLLAVSGGYSRKINDRLSLMAEPYLRIPLTGIGEGKINLKGAGVLFTAGFKPWK